MSWNKAAFVMAIVMLGIAATLYYLSDQGRIGSLKQGGWYSLNDEQKIEAKKIRLIINRIEGTAGITSLLLFWVSSVAQLGRTITPHVRVHTTLHRVKPFPAKAALENWLANLYGILWGAVLISFITGIAVIGPAFGEYMGEYLFLFLFTIIITAFSVGVEFEERKSIASSCQEEKPKEPMLPAVLRVLVFSVSLTVVACINYFIIDWLVQWGDRIIAPPFAASLARFLMHIGALSIISGIIFGIMAVIVLKICTFGGSEKRSEPI